MKLDRSVWVHLGALAVSGALALGLSWRGTKLDAAPRGSVVVWTGRADALTQVVFEDDKRKVVLDAKSDAHGRFFVGSVTRSAAEGTQPKEARFVSVGPAQKLAEQLATLKAYRTLGKVAPERAGELGFEAGAATLTVSLGGTERKLVVGGTTPGGGDRYVKDAASGEVWAVEGDVFKDLELGEARLAERDLHEWKESEADKARLTAAGKVRDAVQGGAVEGKRFWADAAAASAADETIGNFMAKLDKLKPTDLVEALPAGAELLLHVEYSAGSKAVGFLDVHKAAGEGGKAAYYVVSERTRWFGKVPSTAGEQVEQDLPSVVR